MTISLSRPLIVGILLLSACGSSADDGSPASAAPVPCQDVIAKVSGCTGEDPATLSGLCDLDPSEAEQMADLACAGAGKQDNPLSRASGEPCSWNFMCDDDHICRPDDEAGLNHYCAPIGHHYDLCDNDSDCVDGLICTNVIVSAGRCMAE